MSESVTGTGAAAPQHSADLAWPASASTAVVGYNVYRGTTSGGPYAKLNSTPDGGLAYSDTSVQAGQTYFYTITAVASDGNESAHSNEAKAVIPTP
jgi:fibronectin type 3 domain-containing protein